jgi:hypothetical protein
MAPPESSTVADILAIDEQIHNLLMQRAAAVEALRQEPGAHRGLRPAADGAEVRRLAARHRGNFPLRAALRIWREIQMSGLSGEGNVSVHVYAGENALAFWDLARFYFGATLPVIGHATAAAVVHACAEDRSSCGVVPFPESAENVSPWWAQLAAAGEGGPRIIARLPLLKQDGGRFDYPDAYAIGSIEQEATGADSSVLFVETNQELSRARLQALLKQVGIKARILAAGQEGGRSSSRELLIEAQDFVGGGDPRIAALLAAGGEAILRAVAVGGYAKMQISDKDPQP